MPKTQTPMPNTVKLYSPWNLAKQKQIDILRDEEQHFYQTQLPMMVTKLEELGVVIDISQLKCILENATEVIEIIKPFARTA